MLNTGNLGLVIAAAGIGLLLIDKFTASTGTTGGVVYGAAGFLTPIKKAIKIDPTVLLVGGGVALWAWNRFGTK